MSDLERARAPGGEKIIEGLKDALAHALVQRVLHIWSEEMAVERIAEALAAARREGAEAERKLMADEKWFEAGVLTGAEAMRERAAAATAFCCFECSRVIRALPLTPEGPV